MITNTEPAAEAPSSKAPKPATTSENVISLIGGTWLIIGLFVDGYAHSEIIDTATEDFFTPWHGLFYSGFLFTILWLGVIANRRASSEPIWKWMPTGYRHAALGVAVFAVGGVGDGIWHTLFGVETGIDALLSPTHLLLFTGLILMLTAPLRSAAAQPTNPSGWKGLGVPIASATLTTALLAFIFTFAWGLSESWAFSVPFDAATGAGEFEVSNSLAISFVTTALLMVPAVVLLRRWDLPFGAITTAWTVAATLEWIAFGNDGVATWAALIGGLAFEATLVFAKSLGRRTAILSASAVGGIALWASRALIVALMGDTPIRWPAELWGGQIIFGGLIAFAVANLALPNEVLERRGSLDDLGTS